MSWTDQNGNKHSGSGLGKSYPINPRLTMTDQEALEIVITLAKWAANRWTMSTEEYSEANAAISRMEDITLDTREIADLHRRLENLEG